MKKKYSRKCHDCGTPTNNYRCKKCWEKIRKKGCYDNFESKMYYGELDGNIQWIKKTGKMVSL